jgi:fluoride ion exporter CrcB/FEX
LQACVQHHFALFSGSINISKNGTIFDISCSNCNLTSCVGNYINGSLLIVKQSPYILVPTNFTGPWYHDKALQLVKEIKSLLVREKIFVRFLTAGIVAAITTIATMTTVAVALSKSIQNTHYVNTLTQNVSYAFQQQVAIDKKEMISI